MPRRRALRDLLRVKPGGIVRVSAIERDETNGHEKGS